LHSKRKLSNDTHYDDMTGFDMEQIASTKSFRSHTSTSSMNSNNYHQVKQHALGNYQQTTKIIQEFNIQQSTSTSDITVSSTINIKSTAKPAMKPSNYDLLSEADFQRVIDDITPADRDLFDEFLNGIKQKTDDYLFLSSLDDILASSSTATQEFNVGSQQQSSYSFSSPISSMNNTVDQRRRQQQQSLTRGSNTIHYNPHAIPHSHRSGSTTVAAAQTLKQMAVQHQQRIIHNQQRDNETVCANYSYAGNSTESYYPQTQTVNDVNGTIDTVS
jgi:hypothetical protein